MFITTNVHRKNPLFLDPTCARIAVETLYTIQDFYPYFLYGFVIMPDHMHMLARVPEGGSISKIIGVYKRAVCYNVGRGAIWQSRFHMIIPKKPYQALEYIHNNPVEAKLVSTPQDYLWSSGSGKWDVEPLRLWPS